MHRPAQQSRGIRSWRIELKESLQQFLPSGFQVKKTICNRCVSTLRCAIHQHLWHPGIASQPGINFFGTKELPHHFPALGLKDAATRQARGNIFRNLVGAQRRQQNQAGERGVCLFGISQGFTHGQHGLAPAQREATSKVGDLVRPCLFGSRFDGDGQGTGFARQNRPQLGGDLGHGHRHVKVLRR